MPILERPDTVLAYEVSGKGPPVLMIQGIGTRGSAWEPQVTGLGRHYQTLTFDNRGIGGSQPLTGSVSMETMAGDARALMDAAGWESAHVMGHSMGGVIAQQLALDHPRRIRSLSLLCTFSRGRDGARPTPWVLWMTLRTRLGSRASRRRAFLEMLFPESYRQGRDEADLARKVGEWIGRDLAEQPAILMRQLRALGRHDVRDRLGELAAIPALVLSGEKDRIAKPAYGRDLAKGIPGASCEVWPGTAHGLPLQLPNEVNARLERFLDLAQRRWEASGGAGLG